MAVFLCCLQAQERLNVALQPQEGALPPRWLLLEKKKRRQDHKRGSHEAQSTRHRG